MRARYLYEGSLETSMKKDHVCRLYYTQLLQSRKMSPFISNTLQYIFMLIICGFIHFSALLQRILPLQVSFVVYSIFLENSYGCSLEIPIFTLEQSCI